jgi:hypothetical protein
LVNLCGTRQSKNSSKKASCRRQNIIRGVDKVLKCGT